MNRFTQLAADWFERYANVYGTDAEITFEDGERMLLDLIDSCLILRTEADAFWLMLKLAGYDQGPQFTHTHKIVAAEANNDTLILRDNLGRTLRLYPTEDELRFTKWRQYKADDSGRLQRSADQLLAIHTEIAYNWIEHA